jgi:hypothetical protein
MKIYWRGSTRGCEHWIELFVENYGIIYRYTQAVFPLNEKNFWRAIGEMRTQIPNALESLEKITIGEALALERIGPL